MEFDRDIPPEYRDRSFATFNSGLSALESLKMRKDLPQEEKKEFVFNTEPYDESILELQAQRSEIFKNYGVARQYEYLLEVIPEKEVETRFKAVMAQVNESTTALKQWEETGTVLAILQNFKELPSSVRKIGDKWDLLKGKPNVRDLLIFAKCFLEEKFTGYPAEISSGGAASDGEKVDLYLVPGQEPTTKELWSNFAGLKTGTDHHLADYLHHEMVHTFQGKLSLWNQKWRKKELLMEAQANRTEMESSLSNSLKNKSTSELVRRLKGFYNFPLDSKMITSVEEVDQLMALGFTSKEIGELVSEAEWDEQNGHWEPLYGHIQSACRALEIDEDELTELVIAHKYERLMETLKAQIIIAKDLKMLIDDWANSHGKKIHL